MRRITLSISALFLVLALFFVASNVMSEESSERISSENTYNEKQNEMVHQPQIFFVGDIMMGRDVETRMEKYGYAYPFAGVQDIILNADISIGNFEGTVSEIHEQTPLFAMKFSIKPEYLAYLKTVGFDVLSLSNNHSLDYGSSSLMYTRTLCESYALLCAGSPNTLNSYSTQVVSVDEKKVGIIFLHTLITEPDTQSLKRILAELSERSDIQVAYIHWGEEYELTHNKTQEQFAQVLIDNGVDAVIGHHPHVAQDIGFYKGKPIFYSMGNFIFDQYFSDDVQEMYGINMAIHDKFVVYTVIPMSSALSRSQPHRMSYNSQKPFFKRLFAKITYEGGVDVEGGIITVP